MSTSIFENMKYLCNNTLMVCGTVQECLLEDISDKYQRAGWNMSELNLLAPELFFFILAHSVYKM